MHRGHGETTWRPVVFVLILLLGVTLATRAAHADNKATADALFKEAKRLLAEGKIGEACEKLEASLKLVDQLGVRLNLADCYEKDGRLTAAYSEFRRAAVAARKSGDKREAFANERTAAVDARIPRLTIRVADEARVDGLTITLDGAPLEEAMFGVALPVDPGERTVEAAAPGRTGWSTKVTLAEKAAETIEVPALEEGSDSGAGAGAGSTDDDGPADRSSPGRGRKWLALGVGAAGVISLGVGVVFGLQASSKWDDAQEFCDEDGACTDQRGIDLLDEAHSSATMSTIFVGVGVVAIGAGVILYLTAPSSSSNEPARDAGLKIVPIAGPDGAGVLVRGGF